MRKVLLSTVVAMTVLAGCGNGTSGSRVASAGGKPKPSDSAGVVAAYVRAVRQYVTCLRAEGLEVSDPDPKGRIQFGGDMAKLKADPHFTAAEVKCKDKLPPVPAELQDKPKLTAAQIDASRRYATCMRRNGAPDFPDPGPDGYYPEPAPGTTGWDQTSTGARHAGLVCGPIIGEPATPGPGQG